MANNGKRRGAPRGTPPAPLLAARAAYSAAQSDFSLAVRAGADTGPARAALERAGEQLRKTNLQRFEHIAAMRGTTATRAIEELIRLAGQSRYVITAAHAAALLTPIEQAAADLKIALDAAVSRSRSSSRAVVFAEGARDVP